MQKFKKFISAHFAALPDDLEQPFVKKADLVLKFFGIAFALSGIWLIFSSVASYFQEVKALYSNLYPAFIAGSNPAASVDQLRLLYEMQRDQLLIHVFYKLILGLAFVVTSFVFNAVLMAEYISFTLPDKIYLRCFATKEEKEKKRKFSN